MQVRAYNSGECAYQPAIVSTEALHCLQRSSQQSNVLIFLTCVCTWCAGLYPAVLVWVRDDQLPYPSFTGALVVFTPVLLPLFSPLLPSISPSSMTPHRQLSGRFRFAAKLVRCAAHKGLRPTLTFDCVGNRMLFFLLVYTLIMHILLYACGALYLFILLEHNGNGTHYMEFCKAFSNAQFLVINKWWWNEYGSASQEH